jgi:hypothetical protein
VVLPGNKVMPGIVGVLVEVERIAFNHNFPDRRRYCVPTLYIGPGSKENTSSNYTDPGRRGKDFFRTSV